MPSEAGALITKELRGSGVTWQGLTNVYCKLFHFLESDGILDVVNEMHLWALYLFHLYKKNCCLDLSKYWYGIYLATVLLTLTPCFTDKASA